MHTLKATFTDATGTTTSTSVFEVLDVGGYYDGRGGHGKVRNVIFFLGDGMGIAHWTAARIVGHGVTAGNPNGWLAMDWMPGTGAVTTHSLNSIITIRPRDVLLHHREPRQQQPGGRLPGPGHQRAFYAPRVEYLGAYLHRTRGTSTGIVSTADLEDATPAANAVYTAATAAPAPASWTSTWTSRTPPTPCGTATGSRS